MSIKWLKVGFTCLVFACATISNCYGASEYQSATLDGQLRSWRLFTPESYSSTKPLPLLINLHGTAASPEIVTKLNEMEVLGEKFDFIVVAPQAEFRYGNLGPRTWNVQELSSPYNDVNFIKLLIAKLIEEYAIDTSKVYATGFSGGARMSSKLACEMADTLAAVAPVAGIRYTEDCSDSRAIPIITYHGKNDPVNHYVHRKNSPMYWNEGVESAVIKWVNHNQCQTSRKEKIQQGITKITWSGCTDDATVVFINSETGGHTWPGSPEAKSLAESGLGNTDSFKMSETIWNFLNRFSKRSQ